MSGARWDAARREGADIFLSARLVGEFPIRIPGRFPDMPIGILERAGVAAPGGIVRRIGDRRACIFDFGHHSIQFGFTPDIVSKRKLCGASGPSGTFASWARDVQGQMASFKP